MKELLINEPHKFKAPLRYYGIDQTILANNLRISQATLSNMLAGKSPMKSFVEDEIAELLTNLREKARKPKHQKIIKKRTNKNMEKSKVEDKNLSTFKRPKSAKRLAPKKAKKPIIKKRK